MARAVCQLEIVQVILGHWMALLHVLVWLHTFGAKAGQTCVEAPSLAPQKVMVCTRSYSLAVLDWGSYAEV